MMVQRLLHQDLVSMNKHDIILCISLIFIGLFIYGIIYLTNSEGSKAIVYYENKEVLSVDLSINNKYTVTGYNGDVNLEVIDGKIRVTDEISPLHLCSHQGFISKSYESIICLPNKVVVKIEDSDEIDTIVR